MESGEEYNNFWTKKICINIYKAYINIMYYVLFFNIYMTMRIIVIIIEKTKLF